ncbi:electron transport complex protein [Candidatus Photodesmus blepharus]|uniref:Ion-translocating oxidoreductase complex subunit D n=1 Tax=Candidatus Photodesmus blepharonis TaxID=1179155 RepID=A0A084CN17_9GAMM|nr:electron transport complex subunit RsxD [Candidatus Photodesmus blepharus]KEY91196.1 electron transport complex protein [Candidatus Photodesmus blepharus]
MALLPFYTKFNYGNSTPELMKWVALCTLPGLITQSYFFGWGTIIQLFWSTCVALFLETLVMLARKRPPTTALRDNSALVTAWLLAVAIPPLSPWWIIFIGLIFAIVITKQLYGGLGQNLFNPAMIAYVVLLISFPIQMNSWIESTQQSSNSISFIDTFLLIFLNFNTANLPLQEILTGVDGITMATPLDLFKTALHSGKTVDEILQQPQFKDLIMSSWGLVNLSYLMGGLLLLKLQVIHWHIPVSFLSSLAIISGLFTLFSPGTCAPLSIHFLSGSTMLGAFFIATDPVSASTTIKGRLVFGTFIGVMVFIIRSWGSFPDSVAFAVLLANMCVPLIDYYSKPRTYGH